MNKLFQLISVLLIVSLGYAATTSKQPLLQPLLTNSDKLQQSLFGKAIYNMVQLGNKVQADFDDLFVALEQLRNTLSRKREAETLDFRGDGEAHRLESSRLNRLINNYDAQAILFQDEIDTLVAEGQLFTKNLRQQQNQLDNTLQQEEQEQQLIANLNSTFQEQSNDYQEAIQLIGEAIAKLQEARGEQNSVSFIQTNQESITVLAQKIERSLFKLKAKSTQVKPIVQFLAQLEQANGSSLGKAIEALESLRQFYKDGLQANQQEYESQLEQHQQLLAEIQVQIGQLKNVIIPKTQRDVNNNLEAQEIRVNLLNEAQSNSNRENENLEQENSEWATRLEYHDSLLEEIEQQLAIIDQAELLLRQQ